MLDGFTTPLQFRQCPECGHCATGPDRCPRAQNPRLDCKYRKQKNKQLADMLKRKMGR